MYAWFGEFASGSKNRPAEKRIFRSGGGTAARFFGRFFGAAGGAGGKK
jgi:hypothetical protein